MFTLLLRSVVGDPTVSSELRIRRADQDDGSGGSFWIEKGNSIFTASLSAIYFITMYSAWVYILTNNHHTTLYIGVTNNLPTRVWKHRTKRDPKCFTAKYNVSKLVHYQGFETIVEAIAMEKLIKKKLRKRKIALIESMNPEWNDLFPLLMQHS